MKIFPKELFTAEALNKVDNNYNTVWHIAFDFASKQGIFNKSINSMPLNLLTKDLLKQQNKSGQNVLFLAMNNLKYIPQGLITTEALNQCDNLGNTAWHGAATCNSYKQIPTSLFPENLFQLKKRDGELVNWNSFRVGAYSIADPGMVGEEQLTKFRTYAEKLML